MRFVQFCSFKFQMHENPQSGVKTSHKNIQISAYMWRMYLP